MTNVVHRLVSWSEGDEFHKCNNSKQLYLGDQQIQSSGTITSKDGFKYSFRLRPNGLRLDHHTYHILESHRAH